MAAMTSLLLLVVALLSPLLNFGIVEVWHLAINIGIACFVLFLQLHDVVVEDFFTNNT
jgi:low affinity Fe/Cu permease